MNRDLITGIVYTQFDDVKGTTPDNWVPSDLPERLRMLAGIKSVSLLTGEGDYIPKSLVIVPFPSFSLKGIVKFIKWKDRSRRGGFARSTITILFNEADDVIFYKYLNELEVICKECSKRITELEIQKVDKKKIHEEVNSIYNDIILMLDNLRNDEIISPSEIISPQTVSETEETFVFKIIVCGDAEVGKTSLILRFTDDAFKKRYLPTLGVNITEKNVKMKSGALIQLLIWDIAGQKKFQSMRKHFYSGSGGVLLVFDLTRSITFRNISASYRDIQKNQTGSKPFRGFIFGNKSDLENRQVSREDAEKLAKELDLGYIETSALTGENVEKAFYNIAENLYLLYKK